MLSTDSEGGDTGWHRRTAARQGPCRIRLSPFVG